jgi:hypothetical protein
VRLTHLLDLRGLDTAPAPEQLPAAVAPPGLVVMSSPVEDKLALFLAAPVSFDGLLIQCAGRVIRAAPGKDVAEVHDYHDRATPILAASLQRRMPGYRTLGFIRA